MHTFADDAVELPADRCALFSACADWAGLACSALEVYRMRYAGLPLCAEDDAKLQADWNTVHKATENAIAVAVDEKSDPLLADPAVADLAILMEEVEGSGAGTGAGERVAPDVTLAARLGVDAFRALLQCAERGSRRAMLAVARAFFRGTVTRGDPLLGFMWAVALWRAGSEDVIGGAWRERVDAAVDVRAGGQSPAGEAAGAHAAEQPQRAISLLDPPSRTTAPATTAWQALEAVHLGFAAAELLSDMSRNGCLGPTFARMAELPCEQAALRGSLRACISSAQRMLSREVVWSDAGTGLELSVIADHARRLLTFAAEEGRDPNAMRRLARLYLEGTVFPLSHVAAVRWLSRAAEEHGCSQAMLELSEIYRRGCSFDLVELVHKPSIDAALAGMPTPGPSQLLVQSQSDTGAAKAAAADAIAALEQAPRAASNLSAALDATRRTADDAFNSLSKAATAASDAVAGQHTAERLRHALVQAQAPAADAADAATQAESYNLDILTKAVAAASAALAGVRDVTDAAATSAAAAAAASRGGVNDRERNAIYDVEMERTRRASECRRAEDLLALARRACPSGMAAAPAYCDCARTAAWLPARCLVAPDAGPGAVRPCKCPRLPMQGLLC